MKRVAIPTALFCNLCILANAQGAVERPPQFIVISFSNCTILERWAEFRDFVAELDKAGTRVRFTYFVTGANFIPDAYRNAYQGPRQKRGYGTLEFGGTNADVRARVTLANEAHKQGHEIGSHAVGHFDGSDWSPAEWAQEFRAFNNALANVGPANGMPDVVLTLPLPVIGFRSPFFQPGPGLYPALSAFGFRYDASGSATANAWPQKVDGIWRYKTGLIKVPALNKQSHAGSGLQFLRGAIAVHRSGLFATTGSALVRSTGRSSATRWSKRTSTISGLIIPAIARRCILATIFLIMATVFIARRSRRSHGACAACRRYDAKPMPRLPTSWISITPRRWLLTERATSRMRSIPAVGMAPSARTDVCLCMAKARIRTS